MNFVFDFLVSLSLPMLIFPYGMGSLNIQINKAAKTKSENNLLVQFKNDEFMNKHINCMNNGTTVLPEFLQCKKDEKEKLKGITSESDPKLFCCFRVVNYICMKTFLT